MLWVIKSCYMAMRKKEQLNISSQAQKQLRAFGVAAVYLFGSRAERVARPGSDYDFAIIMKDARKATPYVDTALYNQLYDIMSAAIVERDFKTIDLVFLQRAPLYYTINVLKYGILIYDGDPKARLAFEERGRLMYMDFAPYRKQLEEATLAMI